MIELRTVPNKQWTYFTCDWDDDRARGFYNPPMILQYKKNETVIGVGTQDHLYFYKIHGTDETMLLSLNLGLPYAGLEVYDGDTVKVSDVFMQNDYDLEEIGDLDELSPITIAKRLYEYCDY